jgi:hypothetical protein
MYESRLSPFSVEVGEDASVGDGEGLGGIEVGGCGQAEMLLRVVVLCLLGGSGSGTDDVRVSGVAGEPWDGGRRFLSTFAVSTFETGCFRITC